MLCDLQALSPANIAKKMKLKFTKAWISFLRLTLPVDVYKEVNNSSIESGYLFYALEQGFGTFIIFLFPFSGNICTYMISAPLLFSYPVSLDPSYISDAVKLHLDSYLTFKFL